MKRSLAVGLIVVVFAIPGVIINLLDTVAQSATQQESTVTKGLHASCGDLIELQDGKKIQQWDVENVSGKTFSKLEAIIYLYDSSGKKVGTITEKKESLKPGWHWSFPIEVKKTTSKTKLIKLTAATASTAEGGITPGPQEAITASLLFKLNLTEALHPTPPLKNEVNVEKLMKVLGEIDSKYEINPREALKAIAKAQQKEPIEIRQQLDKQGALSTVLFPSKWSEIIYIDQLGKLPVVTFRKGGVVVDLRTISLRFKDGTQAMIGEACYEAQNAQWQRIDCAP